MLQIKKEKRFSRAGWHQAVVCVSYLLLLSGLFALVTGCHDGGDAMIITADVTKQETLAVGTVFSMEEQTSSEKTEKETIDESVENAGIYIHVCGQVAMPGVYFLPEGSRVWDAVEAAGGFLPEAESQAVNLAMRVSDGSKVTIPNEAEADENEFRWYEAGDGRAVTMGGAVVGGGYAVGQENDADNGDSMWEGRININQADVAALMTIPGIGQTRAEAIVSYRETRGLFGSIEEIMKVTGIKDGLFSKIKEYITVGG